MRRNECKGIARRHYRSNPVLNYSQTHSVWKFTSLSHHYTIQNSRDWSKKTEIVGKIPRNFKNFIFKPELSFSGEKYEK